MTGAGTKIFRWVSSGVLEKGSAGLESEELGRRADGVCGGWKVVEVLPP